MFSFSRRRMKLGRVKKVQLSDSTQVMKSPFRPIKRTNGGGTPKDRNPNEFDYQRSSALPQISSLTLEGSDNWKVLSVSSDKPMPRFNHAATVIGNNMMVVGGDSGNGLLDDVQVLNFDRFIWTTFSSKLCMSPSSLSLKIPSCRGHCLISSGNKALLVGGKTNPSSERISVWEFDTETECWSLVEAKGDIPIARSGHSVVRASSVLILFGGEDTRKRKLHDLYMLDLKSLTWLPLHCTGTGPCPRSNHVATLICDKTLLVFGGAAKSRILNDLYSLDFETMMWSRLKIHGFNPTPRTGCCGVLYGTKWYIVGGGIGKKRHAETLVFDVLKQEWSVAATPPPSSITYNKGLSLVLVQQKEKDFLVAFGGSRKEPSNQVEVLALEKNEPSAGLRSLASKGCHSLLYERHHASITGVPAVHLSVDSITRHNLPSSTLGSGRKSISESTMPNSASGNVSLLKQFHNDEERSSAMLKMGKNSDQRTSSSLPVEVHMNQEETLNPNNDVVHRAMMHTYSSVVESETSQGFRNLAADGDDIVLAEEADLVADKAHSSMQQICETQVACLIRKNGVLEGQLTAVMASREATEKSLCSVQSSRQEVEKKLAETTKEMEMLREKLAGVEAAQKEATNLSNIVYSDNVMLEHDVAFLKAVLEDTQKELHSARGILEGERARAFQLQVEVFHLKQRLQSIEHRTPTPRKPFHIQ